MQQLLYTSSANLPNIRIAAIIGFSTGLAKGLYDRVRGILAEKRFSWYARQKDAVRLVSG